MIDNGAANDMPLDRYICPSPNCGYIYDPEVGDPEHGVPAGTPFEDLPDDWCCPICGMSKFSFDNVDYWVRVAQDAWKRD